MIKREMKYTDKMKAHDNQVKQKAKELQATVATEKSIDKQREQNAKDLIEAETKLWPEHPERKRLMAMRDNLWHSSIKISEAKGELDNLMYENPRCFGKPWNYREDMVRNRALEAQIAGLQTNIDALRAKMVVPFPPM